jgi:transcriptional regulator with XRE-family HTH domain
MTPLMQYLVEQTEPKISKQELAKRVRVHPSLITLWMKGHRKPGRATLQQLSKVTGLPIKELLL